MTACPACYHTRPEHQTHCNNCGLDFGELEKLDYVSKQAEILWHSEILSEQQFHEIFKIYTDKAKWLVKKHADIVHPKQPSPEATSTSYQSHEQENLQTTSFQFSAFLDNFSISWLLYLGAFLVSIAAIIFIAYKWQDFSPYIKLLILFGFAGTLYGFGQYTLTALKLRKAGLTLIGLGLFMLPIIFYGMNANLKAIGWSEFWLLNSIFTVGMFTFGAIYYESMFFAWVSVFPLLITTWSVSRIFGTVLEASAFYYVITAIGLLLVSVIEDDRFKKLYQSLAIFSAYTVAITALFIGTYFLAPFIYNNRTNLDNQFLLYLFGTVFFALSSVKDKQISPFITVGLVYFTAGHAGAIYHFKLVHHFYLATLLSVALYASSFHKNIKSFKNAVMIVSLCVTLPLCFILAVAWFLNFLKIAGITTDLFLNPTNTLVLLIITTFYFFLSSLNLHRSMLYLAAVLVPLAVSVIPMIFKLPAAAVAYILIAFAVIYLASSLWKKNQFDDVLLNSSLFIAVFAGFCSFANNTGATIVWIIASIIFAIASYTSENKPLVLGSLISSFIAYSFGLIAFDLEPNVKNSGLMYMPYWGSVFLTGLRFYFKKDEYFSWLLFGANALLSIAFMLIALSANAPYSVIWKLSLFYGLFAICMALLYENVYYAGVGYLLLTGTIGYGLLAFSAKKLVVAYSMLVSSLLWYGTSYIRLAYKPFEKIRWGIISVVIFDAWLGPLFFPLGKQLTILLISTGFLFVFYFLVEKKEMYLHMALVSLIGSLNLYSYYWQNIQILEYYLIPWSLYLMILGLTYLRMPDVREYEDMPSRRELAQFALWCGGLLMLAPPLLLSLVESFPHAWIIFIAAPLIVVLGVQHRVKSFVFIAGVGIILEGFLQVREPLMSLPKWVILGSTGLGLISSAVVFERNRSKVIQFTKDTVQIFKEWN